MADKTTLLVASLQQAKIDFMLRVTNRDVKYMKSALGSVTGSVAFKLALELTGQI